MNENKKKLAECADLRKGRRKREERRGEGEAGEGQVQTSASLPRKEDTQGGEMATQKSKGRTKTPMQREKEKKSARGEHE